MVMQTVYGDIWKLAGELDYIVIPTNIGWKQSGDAIMGAGIARMAAEADPTLPFWYGKHCQKFGAETYVTHRGRFILFPTKPLNKKEPWTSWKRPSCIQLIRRSMEDLLSLAYGLPGETSRILLPLVGCGNGKLKKAQVLPVLERFWHPRYTLVLRKVA